MDNVMRLRRQLGLVLPGKKYVYRVCGNAQVAGELKDGLKHNSGRMGESNNKNKAAGISVCGGIPAGTS